jgi:hypothetical protein
MPVVSLINLSLLNHHNKKGALFCAREMNTTAMDRAGFVSKHAAILRGEVWDLAREVAHGFGYGLESNLDQCLGFTGRGLGGVKSHRVWHQTHIATMFDGLGLLQYIHCRMKSAV